MYVCSYIYNNVRIYQVSPFVFSSNVRVYVPALNFTSLLLIILFSLVIWLKILNLQTLEPSEPSDRSTCLIIELNKTVLYIYIYIWYIINIHNHNLMCIYTVMYN